MHCGSEQSGMRAADSSPVCAGVLFFRFFWTAYAGTFSFGFTGTAGRVAGLVAGWVAGAWGTCTKTGVTFPSLVEHMKYPFSLLPSWLSLRRAQQRLVLRGMSRMTLSV